MPGIKKAPDLYKICIILSFQAPVGGKAAWSWWQVGPPREHLPGWEEEGEGGGGWAEGLMCSPHGATPLCHVHATAHLFVSIYSAILRSAEPAGQLKGHRLLYCNLHELNLDCSVPMV